MSLIGKQSKTENIPEKLQNIAKGALKSACVGKITHKQLIKCVRCFNKYIISYKDSLFGIHWLKVS